MRDFFTKIWPFMCGIWVGWLLLPLLISLGTPKEIVVAGSWVVWALWVIPFLFRKR